MDAISTYLLAGGRSRRFGSDKVRALLDGEPLLAWAARPLARFGAPTVVAGRAGAYDDLGFRTIADARPGMGPLAGLEAALDDAGTDWLFLGAGDFVGADPAWIDRLLDARRPDAVAIAFRDAERWMPVFALYHRASRPAVTRALDAGRLAARDLLDAVDAVAVEPPDDFGRARSVDDPATLEAMRDGVVR